MLGKIKQWSKAITLFLVFTEFITWLLIFHVARNDYTYLDTLINHTSGMFTAVMPYFALTMVERITNWDQITNIFKYLDERKAARAEKAKGTKLWK